MRISYKAVNKDGKFFKGIIEAKDSHEAASYLRLKGLLPTVIRAQQDNKFLKVLSFYNRSNSSDVVFFTRQLSSMLSSGLTLMEALRILKEQVQKQEMVDVLNGMVAEIEEGKPFSDSLAKYSNLFSPIYVSLIKAAEASGLLDKVLLRLADNLEKQEKIKSSIKSALMYPVIVITGMIIVVIIMMIVVIPQLTTLYQNLNIPLPLPTQIIIALSNFFIYFWPIILIAIVLSIIFYKRWEATSAGKLVIDDTVLKIPIFGKLIKQTILTEFSRTFGLLIGSGTLVIDALNQVADVAGNIKYKNAILGVSRRVEKGISIGDAMSDFNLFPPILIEMVKIGEQTGKLDESLLKVSEYFEREVEQTVKTLTSALEPVIMVFLGIGVAFLIISIITPIYNLTSTIQ